MRKLFLFLFILSSLFVKAQVPSELQNVVTAFNTPGTASGTIAANATNAATISVNGQGTYVFQLTGTWVATLQVQISLDGTTFVNVTGSNTVFSRGADTYIASGNVTTNGIYEVQCTGINSIRVITTAYTSGTVTVTARASNAESIVGLKGVPPVSQSGTWTMQPGNTANTTAWLVEPRTGTTNGTTTSTVNSAATTNATNLKATAGMIYNISIMNASAATKYIRIYNKATAPTVGTDIPIMVIAVPATSSKEFTFMYGLKMSTGIGYAITNAAGATDATAVAAGDVQLLINWQ